MLLAILAVGAVLLYFLDPMEQKFMPKCMFKTVTGLNCPGCGFQRAMHALLHGRLSEALHYNLFLAIGIPYLAAVFSANALLQGEKRAKVLNVLEGRLMAWFYVVTFIIWFIVRNILNI